MPSLLPSLPPPPPCPPPAPVLPAVQGEGVLQLFKTDPWGTLSALDTVVRAGVLLPGSGMHVSLEQQQQQQEHQAGRATTESALTQQDGGASRCTQLYIDFLAAVDSAGLYTCSLSPPDAAAE